MPPPASVRPPAPNAATTTRPGAGRSWHAHVAAFLAGALTPAELRACYPQLQADPAVRRPIAGFMECWLLLAWFDAGLTREALDEMRSCWGQMLTQRSHDDVGNRGPARAGLDTMDVGARSQCHGWSASPAWLLPAKVLDVTPTAPGFREVALRPALGDLHWAEGKIPTPHGVINMAWSEAGHGEVTLPAGVTARLHRPGREPVVLPGGTGHRIT
jgi:hypothetical protein